MRHCSLSFTAVLLFSSIVVAQRHEAGSAPPPPSPAPSAAPAPAPTPPPSPPLAPAPVSSPSFSPSPVPSAPVSHISPPSMPVSIPEAHVAPAPGISTIHAPSVTVTEPNSGRAAPVAHAPQSDARGIIPDQKISGEHRIVSAPRIGENPPEKEKPAPDLRHRICLDGPCKDAAAKPEPPQSDLRHRVCLNGPCSCPPGQSWGKNGCAATAVVPPADQCQPGEFWNGGSCVASSQCAPGEYWNGATCLPSSQCTAGEFWNGATCLPSNECPVGEFWNGVNCVPFATACASISGRAAILINELRGLKAQILQACGQNPPAPDCDDLKLQQKGALLRYQMLLNEAGPDCRTTLPAPVSLE